MLSFPDQNGANLAVSSGRAQLGFADSPVAAYAVKQSNGQFKLVGAAYATAPYGLATLKGNGLDKALLAALKVVMAISISAGSRRPDARIRARPRPRPCKIRTGILAEYFEGRPS